MDWDDYRYFLAVARRGTLSAAARELSVTQPTVGRRIVALERRLGAKLYLRRPDGFTLSEAGKQMLAHSEGIEREVLAAEMRVTGRDAGLRGVVRITASEWLCTSVLPPVIQELVARHPQLELELVADQRHLNLARREADLALRPRRFEQAGIVHRAIAPIRFGLYAARRYLAKHGNPRAGDGTGHVVIGMLEDVGDVARAWLASVLPNGVRAVRTNGRDAMVSLATAGVGIACLAEIVGGQVHGLERVHVAPEPPAPTLWLGMPRELRSTPRVRVVADLIVQKLRARLGN